MATNGVCVSVSWLDNYNEKTIAFDQPIMWILRVVKLQFFDDNKTYDKIEIHHSNKSIKKN